MQLIPNPRICAECPYIYVFNLQGEPLCKYTLDRYITGFHVDERNKTITATDVNNDQPIVEFRFG